MERVHVATTISMLSATDNAGSETSISGTIMVTPHEPFRALTATDGLVTLLNSVVGAPAAGALGGTAAAKLNDAAVETKCEHKSSTLHAATSTTPAVVALGVGALTAAPAAASRAGTTSTAAAAAATTAAAAMFKTTAAPTSENKQQVVAADGSAASAASVETKTTDGYVISPPMVSLMQALGDIVFSAAEGCWWYSKPDPIVPSSVIHVGEHVLPEALTARMSLENCRRLVHHFAFGNPEYAYAVVERDNKRFMRGYFKTRASSQGPSAHVQAQMALTITRALNSFEFPVDWQTRKTTVGSGCWRRDLSRPEYREMSSRCVDWATCLGSPLVQAYVAAIKASMMQTQPVFISITWLGNDVGSSHDVGLELTQHNPFAELDDQVNVSIKPGFAKV